MIRGSASYDGWIRAESGAALARQKRRGKRFQRFCRDALVGNPGDPLIGFPILVYRRELQTENREFF